MVISATSDDPGNAYGRQQHEMLNRLRNKRLDAVRKRDRVAFDAQVAAYHAKAQAERVQ